MFKVSTKSDYGMLLMSTLAEKKRAGRGFVSLDEIAHEKKLSLKYLSQIILPLKKSGLVVSKEGRGGGYALALPAGEINLLDIIKATEGPVSPVRCCSKKGAKCGAEAHCTIKGTWKEAQSMLVTFLEKRTLADTL